MFPSTGNGAPNVQGRRKKSLFLISCTSLLENYPYLYEKIWFNEARLHEATLKLYTQAVIFFTPVNSAS